MNALIHIRDEAGELRLLFEVCQALDDNSDQDWPLQTVLTLIARHTGMQCAMLLLRNPDGSIRREAGFGALAGKAYAAYPASAETSRMVLDTALPAAMAAGGNEAFALDRVALHNRAKEDIAFIAVPVLLGGQPMGVLTVDRLFADSVALEEDVRLLRVLASLIGQALCLRLEFEERHSAVMEENRRLQVLLAKQFRPTGMVGISAAMRDVFSALIQVAGSNATVLLRGESGTGKELVATAIHAHSSRADKPFVRLNCAALPEGLVESELFGHERGAFTGATGTRKGRFEIADGGTLFLDEVGDLAPLTQAKLLRVLQEKEFERVGGAETRRTDVRLIAATNRDLEAMTAQRQFRQDLYYRLNVFPIMLPPLRERRTDIMPLATHFAEKYGEENNRPVLRISAAATALLTMYGWPGNVRELENVMERAVLLCGPSGVIEAAHLPSALQRANAGKAPEADNGATLDAALADLESRLITEALTEAGGVMGKAAAYLGVTERVMGLRMKKYGIDYRDFRGKVRRDG
jgi:Nif-specific regulatory protein